MSDITYSWNEYIRLNEELVYKVAKSGWQFDCLICLSRGGMRPGDFFSRIYGKPLAVLATSSYREAKGTVQSNLDIAECMTGLAELKGKVLAHLKKRYPAITEIRVAVLWWKAHSVLKPDWHCVYFEDSPWIHQPFECYDDLGAEAFIEAIESGKTLGRLQ